MKRQILALALVLGIVATASAPAFAAGTAAQRAFPDGNYSTVSQGGYVYTSVRGPIERISLQTQARETVVAKNTAYDLQEYLVQDGRLYWSGQNAVYTSGGNGAGLQKLPAGGAAGQKVSNLRVGSGWLYYLLGGQLYRMQADGSGRSKLDVGPVERFELVGESLCYRPQDGDALYHSALDGTGAREIAQLEGDWEPEVYGDSLFYPADGIWYRVLSNGKVRMSGRPIDWLPSPYAVADLGTGLADRGEDVQIYRTDETGRLKPCFSLPNAIGSRIRGSQNFLYYDCGGKEEGLYRVDWNGKNREKVADGGDPILFAGGYLVYYDQNDIHLVKDA